MSPRYSDGEIEILESEIQDADKMYPNDPGKADKLRQQNLRIIEEEYFVRSKDLDSWTKIIIAIVVIAGIIGIVLHILGVF